MSDMELKENLSTVVLPPHLGALVSQLTDTSDVKTALVKVLSEYLELKIHVLRERLEKFESKWRMSFEEFAERCETQTLPQDAYAYEVEQDFWEWEQTVTLLQHYEALQTQWM